MRKIYTIVFALMVLLSVSMSATAAAPTKIIPPDSKIAITVILTAAQGAASAGYAAPEAPVPYTSTVLVD
jgi:hypothetical protein